MQQRDPISVSQRNILLVDDSSASRLEVAGAFAEVGYNITEAFDGSEALNHARLKNFDAVITDIHMPGSNGLELIEKLRGLPSYKDTPLIVLTSDCSSIRLEQGRKLGATAWLVKPANLKLLVSMVNEELEDP